MNADQPQSPLNSDASAPTLAAVGIGHWFDGPRSTPRLKVLEDVTLYVQEGEVVSIVGPSGCGKSTLLRILAGLVEPCEGVREVGGEPPSGKVSNLGIVFQESAILPWRTVARNVAHGLEIQRIPKAARDRQVRRLIELMGLDGFENHYPHQLSVGMRQRAEVARTWAVEPKIVLMDEPFAAVDAITRQVLQEELRSLTDQTNTSVVLVTHSVDEAVLLGDRVIVMSSRPGRIVAEVAIPVARADRSQLRSEAQPEISEAATRVMELIRREHDLGLRENRVVWPGQV